MNMNNKFIKALFSGLLSIVLVFSTFASVLAAGGSGGGTGGGNAEPISLVGAYLTNITDNTSTTGESIKDNTNVDVKPTIKLQFDRNVVNSTVWENNSKTISLTDADETAIEIDVFRISDDVNSAEKQHIFVSPVSPLTYGKTYKLTINSNLTGKDGNKLRQTETVLFTVKADSTPPITEPTSPKLIINTPANNTVTNKNIIEVAGTTDAGCVVEINNEEVAAENGIFKDEVTLTPGLNKIKITSTNAEGKSTDAFWNVTYDNVAPLLTISSPKNNLITNKAKITITGTSEKGATVKVNGTVVPLDVKSNFTKEVSLVKGANKVTVTATDLAGNLTEVKLQVTYDNVAPVLTITSPKNNLLTNKAKVTVNGSSEKGATVKINGAVVPLNTKNVFSKAVTLKKGVNTLTITATDAAGNTKTAKLKVTYDNAAILKITSPKNNLKTKLSKVTISGSSEKGAKVKINGKVVKLNAKNSFSKVVTLKKGVNTVTITAKDAAGNSKTVKVKVTRLK